MDFTFRWAGPADYETLADVMFDAVRNGGSPYSESQRAAWVPARRGGEAWSERLAGQHIVLAEREGQAFGFMSLAGEGYVDFAYIRASARGSGLFRQMLERIEQRAAAAGIGMLWVHASLAAQPAFSAVGFTVRKQEEVALGSERLTRFEMEKKIGRATAR